MMQVEEKPDVTYSDVGGCKEQIEKLREVVETPLLSVRALTDSFDIITLIQLHRYTARAIRQSWY
jgi:ATP-dependent 26S proteasome regulatory subunit